jgi:phage terminase small subunit
MHRRLRCMKEKELKTNKVDRKLSELAREIFQERDYNPIFMKNWKVYWKDIRDRENLKESHLLQLAEMCDLCVERDEIALEIKEDGRMIYDKTGKRANPLTATKNQTITSILKYHKLLGLSLYEDKAKNEAEEEASEWS